MIWSYLLGYEVFCIAQPGKGGWVDDESGSVNSSNGKRKCVFVKIMCFIWCILLPSRYSDFKNVSKSLTPLSTSDNS